ncbi:MAG: tetratricopeptide repeat protein [Pseudomonadota bacterium]
MASITRITLAAALTLFAFNTSAFAQSKSTENDASASKTETPAPPRVSDAEGASREKAAPGPTSVAERDRILSDMYKRLSEADNPDYAKLVSTAIEKLWVFSGSDTVDLLMRRAQIAIGKKDPSAAKAILNAVVGLRPSYAEAWNRRAFVHFSSKDYQAALSDLRRVLILDPKHFKAIGGLAVILREYGRDEAALAAFRRALAINPQDEDVRKAVKELQIEVEGRAI